MTDDSYLVGPMLQMNFHLLDNLLLIAGVLLYFSDGLLPLLTAYYKGFFEPSKDKDTRQKQMEVSAKIVTALLVSQLCTSRFVAVSVELKCCQSVSARLTFQDLYTSHVLLTFVLFRCRRRWQMC